MPGLTWVSWAFLGIIRTLGQWCIITVPGLKTWQGNVYTKHTRACSLLERSLELLFSLGLPLYAVLYHQRLSGCLAQLYDLLAIWDTC